MKKEEYLHYRNNNSLEPLYEYYKENWNDKRDRFFLNIMDFMESFRFWPESTMVYHNVMAYYDVKFTVMKVENLKTGQIIRYL